MVLIGFQIVFFWLCLPKTVGFEGIPNPLLCLAGRLCKDSRSDVFS